MAIYRRDERREQEILTNAMLIRETPLDFSDIAKPKADNILRAELATNFHS